MTSPTDTTQLAEVLQQYWGYSSFRPLQQEAMQCVLGGRDSVVVLPTGGGKSLCFQAPAVCLPGLALVVSPLISLMKDQVDALRTCGVPAACVNSTLAPHERRRVADDIRAGTLKLLYVAPERLVQERMLDFLHDVNISLIAIDEAHCISEWGHDFRPEYRALKVLKQTFPGVGVHAYTATATPQGREDIAHQLGLNHPKVLVGSFDRPNLIYRVERRANRLQQIVDVINRHRGESGIVYCISRKNVEETAGALNEMGYKARPYHAGMSDDDRHRSQDAFIEEKVDTIVATVAFGMGIDKSNVRYVVHAGMPKSLEGYQQESGRAGRDGLEAECCLFYSGGDFMLWKKMLAELPAEARAGAMHTLNAMYDFCTGVTCRHKGLVAYFGQEFEKPSCNACDVCLGDVDLVEDPLIVGQKILSCVVRLEQRFGGDYTSMVLTGSADQRILESGHDRLSTYGLLKDQNRKAVRDWIEQLVGQGYLEKFGEYNVLRVTDDGRRLLRGEVQPRLMKPKTRARKDRDRSEKVGVAADSWEGVDQGLFDALRELRREKADERNVPAYIVFGDGALRDMARRRPTTLAAFREVSGVGDKKCADYGEEFTSFIARYAAEHALDSDVNAPVVHVPPPASHGEVSNGASYRAFDHFRQGRSLDEVAAALSRARSTVSAYLFDFLRHDNIADPSPWVDNDTVRRIERAIEEVGFERLKPIYDALGGTVDYDQIRIVLACLKNAGALSRPTPGD